MPRPANLLFILSDNHHRDYAGCYGHPNARTPNIDALAARGTLFRNAYAASPLCCPSRAALATGRFPHQTGYWDNAIVYDGRVPSWMRRLSEAGHAVTSIGKLHYRRTTPDNGFSEELLPMHILDGKGGVHMLMRGLDDEHPNRGQWELYMERSGIGVAPYQPYDRRITATALDWLGRTGRAAAKPWVLFVSYPSPHPPFSVPEEFYRLFDETNVVLPAGFAPGDRSEHPAMQHLRHIMGTRDIVDEAALRRIVAGYLGLIAHLDNEIGQLIAGLAAHDLAADTRVIYTSDHGDLCGGNGIFGKCNLFEGSIGVPLVMAGSDIPAGRVADDIVSHVDLFPTILDSLGVTPADSDADLPGTSLWPALSGPTPVRPGFAEFHATGSKAGMFMLRDGRWKLIYHVGMARQLFDLATDPAELADLGPDHPEADRLEALLREICDPEAVDARAKADQRRWIEHWGGAEAILADGTLVYTPPPGEAAEIAH